VGNSSKIAAVTVLLAGADLLVQTAQKIAHLLQEQRVNMKELKVANVNATQGIYFIFILFFHFVCDFARTSINFLFFADL
jgi:hypothetical protein